MVAPAYSGGKRAVTERCAALPGETTLGARVRRIRLERRLTQEELAERARISVDMLSKTEQGKRYPRLPVLMRIASALDVPVSELVDTHPRLNGAQEGANVLALRNALLSPAVVPGLGLADSGEPVTVPALQAAVDDAGASYWQGDFARMAAVLPDLISTGRVTRDVAGADAAAALAQAYDLAAALLVHLGKEDLAAIAAERAIAVAASAGDERLLAMMQGT